MVPRWGRSLRSTEYTFLLGFVFLVRYYYLLSSLFVTTNTASLKMHHTARARRRPRRRECSSPLRPI